MRVDQYLPDFAPHDAVGQHVLQVRQLLRRSGFDSDIWSDVIHGPLVSEARSYHDHPAPGPGGGAIMLYHASTYSDMAAWLQSRSEAGDRVLSYYHNITPAMYFARWEPVAAAGCERARVELAALAPVTELAMAASAFNEAELVAAGYRSTVVSPLLIDLSEYHAPPTATSPAASSVSATRAVPGGCSSGAWPPTSASTT